MLKDGMRLCSRCGRSTSGMECTNPGCQDALASARLAAVTAERDAYLETIHATFRVLESRGQAPDDNAPLQVTVRRVLDFLGKVTAERDSWRQVHKTALNHAEERENHHAETVARLSAERDNLKARVELLEAYARADATSALYVGTERDALAAKLSALKEERDLHERRAEHFEAEFQRVMKESWSNIAELAALKKRIADAPRKMLYPRDEGEKTGWVAMITLEDGE